LCAGNWKQSKEKTGAITKKCFDESVTISSSARIAISALRPGIDGRNVRIPQRGNARAQQHSGKDETYHSQCYPEARLNPLALAREPLLRLRWN
jgi:hypothetical protein